MKIVETDCLIIGSGAAGIVYGAEASKAGLDCIMITATEPEISNSWLAQGGIVFPQDGDESLLLKDLAIASSGTFYEKSANELIFHARRIMKRLEKEGLPFDKTPQGNFDLVIEAAHSIPRIIHSKDSSGRALAEYLWKGLQSHVDVQRNKVAIDLLTLSHSSTQRSDRYHPSTCIGAYILDTQTQEVSAILAQRTILATGGLGQIYSHTTNHQNAYGHGISMAYRLGARVIDMEYVQFHPTSLYAEGHERNFLISEAVRGEGATFVNIHGEDILKHHPMGALAPRDVVSRAVFFEMLKNGNQSVFLDLRKISQVKEKFPKISSICQDQKNLNIENDLIPITPAAHYFCGGIHADMSGTTNIVGLRAIGENACTGLHGANRLASTSLLECLVMGELAATLDIAELKKSKIKFPGIKFWKDSPGVADMELIQQDLSLIKNTMWNYVGLVRTEKRLKRAQKILNQLKEEIDQFYSNCRISLPLLNLRSAVQTSLLVTYAALRNTTSQGCHYRADEP